MAEKSGTSIISLPQGGGALKGIGETFAPDLFTGTGNFSVPIALPPGRNGFQPDLSLVYSTGNGNGPFGLGWGLSVPGVSRKTSKGIPRYDDVTDVFILSGAEDLVPVSGELPGEMQFRPRTEGLFALITFRRDPDTNDSFWEVRSKDGLVSRYGTPGLADNDPATVADPADVSRVFVWKLTQTIDPFGNRIEYEYERDRGEEGPHHWDQLYLKQIRYVDFDDHEIGEERFLITVTLYYEERPDPFSEYRAGFEIRTRKRCQEIVVETHPSRDKSIRVRTYDLTYLDELVAEDGLPPNRVSLLSQIWVIGHDDDQPLEADRTQELPPLEFGYTNFEPQSRRFSPVAGADLPAGSLADPTLELTSLFGNGLTDIFEMNGTVRYWRNLGGGVFDRPREMRDAPAGLALADPGVQLIDANGDGRADLMVTSAPLAGYFPLTFSGAWDRRSFQRYRSAPSFDLEDPEVKLVDLDGDGVTDAIRSGSRLECFFNHPREGWTWTRQVDRRNLEDFPNVSFSDPRIKWADMSGDGLQNVVLVHDGHIDYWPNLGYGDWGKRVSMRNSPRFPFGYDPKRILFGDVDGDGLADLLYVDDHKVTLWINQSGNAWSAPIEIRGTPGISDMDSVRLDDLRGTGVAGVLWSGVFSAPGRPHMFFLDLTGGTKPYLLDEMNNHMGAVTRVRYASSTEFYLADRAKPATPWRTTLPFPVQVVACVEVTDEISGGKLTTEYIYHHGYWDGGEREFRGFGRVDQRDTEVFDDYNASSLHADRPFAFVPKKAFSPPTETRTWFHLGPVGEEHGPWEELDLSQEYWSGDPPMPVLGRPDELEGLLQALPRRARRDAVRALRGRILRTELYATDGSEREDRPYTVTEFAYGLREEDRPDESTAPERLRIFFPHTLGQRTTQWERGDDPMTVFSFADDYDDVGQPRRQTQIACPRGCRRPNDVPTETYLATQSRTEFARPVGAEAYIMDRIARTTTYEILNTGGKAVSDVKKQADDAEDLKVIGQALNFYDGPAFIGLALGEVEQFGALVRTETLVLTEEILRQAYNPSPENANPLTEIPPYFVTGADPPWTDQYPEEFRNLLPPLAGYVFRPGDEESERGYFVNTTRREYDIQAGAQERGLVFAMLDPLSQSPDERKTRIEYDRFELLPAKVTDPVGLETSARYDERILHPVEVTDPNGNRRRFAYTPLGLLRHIAVMGKETENAGDTEEVPGTAFTYNLTVPLISVRTLRRVHHVNEEDVPAGEEDETVETVEYSDGFGRLLQTRTQAEDVLFGDPVFGGQLLSLDQGVFPTEVAGREGGPEGPLNVVVSGWQTYNNKGRLVEKYEPFFTTGFDYAPPEADQFGRKTTLFYDPRGQVIRTVNPDGSEQRVVFGVPGTIAVPDLAHPEVFEPTAWESYTYDENDNAGRTPDVAGADRVDPSHIDTPTSILVDALGRIVSSIERDGIDSNGFETRSSYDIRGNLLTVMDALGREVFRYVYDLANRALRIESIDAGVRRIIFDAAGNEVERWDSKGAVILQLFDTLNRPIRLWARDDGKEGSDVTLRERLEYGDGDPDKRNENREKNRLGALHRHFDEAGQLTFEAYDFKGNVLEKVRRVIGDEAILSVFPPRGGPPPSRGIRVFRVDWGSPDANVALDPTPYETSVTYDALNRINLMRYPRDQDQERKELQPKYNRAGALEQVRLGEDVFVDHIAYDAKGQRTLIALGNGVLTLYGYHPTTLRLGRVFSAAAARMGDFSYKMEPLSTEERKQHLFQDFGYDHDLIGNITTIHDRAPDCGVPETQLGRHALDRTFSYDAVYRLLSATGRECDLPSYCQPWRQDVRCTDLTKLKTYKETYMYDPVGNMLELGHRNNGNGFTRRFDHVPGTNRLAQVTVGDQAGDVFDYQTDENGNLTRETTSRHFAWNHSDQLKAFRTEDGAGNVSVQAHYLYDSGGIRVKKLVRNQAGQFETTVYIDGLFEHHRRSTETPEYHTLHIMDDKSQIATKRIGKPFTDDRTPGIQFHLGDHLGSRNVVVDEAREFVNREEYTPYGETSFGSFARKRYRLSGKERDEESGFHYFGARYYAAWIGRWVRCDPLGHIDGVNCYQYVHSEPISHVDPEGLQAYEHAADPKAAADILTRGFDPSKGISGYTWFEPKGQSSTGGPSMEGKTAVIEVQYKGTPEETLPREVHHEWFKEAEARLAKEGLSGKPLQQAADAVRWRRVAEYLKSEGKTSYRIGLKRGGHYLVLNQAGLASTMITRLSGSGAGEVIARLTLAGRSQAASTAEMAGLSAAAAKRFGHAASVIKWVGKPLIAVAVAQDLYEIYRAEFKPRTVTSVAGGWGAAWAGGKAGLKAGVKIGAGIALAVGQAGPQAAAPEEIVTAPLGGAIGGVLGGIGGAVGGYFFGRKVTETVYDWVFE